MAKLLDPAAGVLCAFVFSLSPACHPRCNDGFVETDCEPEPVDEAATPGDDRAGFVACAGAESAEICGPGSGCCGDGSRCASDAGECESSDWFSSCDGPEDCAPGEQCWVDDQSIRCSTEATPYSYVRCHTDTDCPTFTENACVNGYCLGEPESERVTIAD